ncbi:hypothetical protein Zmor_028230 [Zophobas morio]|uniref:Gustatory receptor n=1 Tax=Zophobas morio TaxID=2755281 RepID=A0AA38M397_9CUCU|nr:hypothetical protein Zmor_028230 [Zophobas morio]
MSPQLLESTSRLVKFIYNVLGIVQFSYDKTPPRTKFAKIVPRLWSVLSYSTFIHLCIFFNNSRHDGKIMTYVQVFLYHGTVVLMILLFITFYKRSNKIKTLLICIGDMVVPLSSSVPRKKRIIIRSTLVGVLFALIIASSFQEGNTYYFIFWYYCCIIIAFDTVFINDIFDHIGDKFAAVNEELQLHTKCDKSVLRFHKKTTFRDMNSLQNLSHFHAELVFLTLEITKQFEVPIIVSMIHSFICMIDGSYTVTVLAAYSQHLTSRFATNFIYLVFALLRLYVLIVKICETQELANSGVLHLHEIWNQHVSRKEMNREFRHLELLSVCMSNARVQFNIRGFFILDWTFFQTMVVAFTTYWLILVQFQV